MKEIYNEYKSNIKELLSNKLYVFFIILVAILSYGFTITNFSVGIDDLCFDRYVTGNFILPAGRWGTTLLYSILQIFRFTPFWLEIIVTILTVIMGIIFTAFIKKESSNKLKNIHYIIATSILISYPLLHQSFIYQSTNLSVIISNLALMIVAIIIYEEFFKRDGTVICLFALAIILPFFISMYESCVQTYICMTAIIVFIQVYNKDKNILKKLIKYIFISIIILVLALIINFLISNAVKAILSSKGLLEKDYSSKAIPWLNFKENNVLERLRINIGLKTFDDFNNLEYIRNFYLLALLSLVITVIETIKQRKPMLLVSIIVIIFSNFLINLLQIRILYRIDTSWCIAIAFFAIYILMYVNSKKINNILSILFCIIIFFQTKSINQLFYNDYIRYQKEANYAYSLANKIISECTDTSKPIVYLYNAHDGRHQNKINEDNGWSLINWSAYAFSEQGSEMTKFINSLGYNFTTATNEKINEVINDLTNSEISLEDNKKVYEANNYILVVLEYNI